MPAWIIQILVSLAIKIGVPALAKLIPSLPQQVIDIINALLAALKTPDASNSSAKKTAIKAIQEHYSGVGTPPEILKL